MAVLKIANCWGEKQRKDVEFDLEARYEKWCKRWFNNVSVNINWYWNKALFGCATQIKDLNAKEQNNGWEEAAKLAIGAKNTAQFSDTMLDSLIEKMQNDFFNEPEDHAIGQKAALVCIDIKHEIQLFVFVSSSKMPRERPKSSNKITGSLVDKILEDQKVRISSMVESAPVALDKLLSIKVGDHFVFKQAYDATFEIKHKETRLANGYLASHQGRRALIIKGDL